jgi:hypothetical protein
MTNAGRDSDQFDGVDRLGTSCQFGDVHGQFDRPVGLLSYMGYRDTGGVWRHPNRSVIFVGDLIDGGPKQLATDPEPPAEFLRPHGKPGNLQQHKDFLSEVEHGMRRISK